uniref:F-box family protein n=1 Tax=Pithovirus LCPAC403 TaxID=2506596 RepID=A0A481ZDY3_9VIRU|nr:MAG: F-box family protein [Pithovirus LCPAC403]
MASVSEILAKLNLNRRDLSNVSLVQLETIFKDLTVKEISTLCTVNKRFNTLCENESFWRNKVSDDYGIHKKYGKTWRETAINMDKYDMINLDDVWINGKTYMEMLDWALQDGTDIIIDSQTEYLCPYANDDVCNLDELSFLADDDAILQNFANEVLDRDYTEDELDVIFYIKNREMNIIYATVDTYKNENGYLPGNESDTASQSYEVLREMIDPILYVMQFSSFPKEKLK